MRILAFAVREDEKLAFNKYKNELNLHVDLEKSSLKYETVGLAKGYDAVTFLGNCDVDSRVLEVLAKFGIKFIASRSTGYNNIDLKAAKELGIKVSNSTYSPYSVAEFTVMMAFNLLRKIPETLSNVSKYNFSLKNLIGKEIRSSTVGVIGAGKIGKIVATHFKALGAKVNVYDLYQNDATLNYVSLDEIFEKSDIITLHSPLTPDTRHLIDEVSLSKMKDGVIIINTARGELIDTPAILKYLNNGKIGALALDTIEGEVGILHKDCSVSNFDHDILKELISKKNVTITSHQAFYTEEAVSDMVESALKNLDCFYKTGDAPNNLIK
ncbi:MAG: NAD(P)-dependent oxidoreductase [Cetobacterium sp.]